MRLQVRGHLIWGAAHNIASGAFKVDYKYDEKYLVTSLSDA